MNPARPILALSAIVLVVLAGCTSPPTPSPTPSVSAPNACTPFPAPEIEAGPTLRGENAFDFMLGLVCDHSGPQPKERARVPGTQNHTEGAAYLYDALKEHSSLAVRFQNFTGSAYEAIMTQNTESAYSHYFRGCRGDDLLRMRGLQFSNIEARGGTAGGPLFLLMAHWDSKRHAMDHPSEFISANDGPSGVGVLLETARVLSGDTLAYEVRILLTDGEDGFEDCHPLAGSTYYAENLAEAERARVRSIILLDMVGDVNATFYKGCGSDTELMDRIWGKARELDVRQFRQEGQCNGTLDDHTPFEERGMKAVDVIDTGRPGFTPYWHTHDDTPDKLSPEVLGGVGRVVEAIVREPVANTFLQTV